MRYTHKKDRGGKREEITRTGMGKATHQGQMGERGAPGHVCFRSLFFFCEVIGSARADVKRKRREHKGRGGGQSRGRVREGSRRKRYCAQAEKG